MNKSEAGQAPNSCKNDAHVPHAPEQRNSQYSTIKSCSTTVQYLSTILKPAGSLGGRNADLISLGVQVTEGAVASVATNFYIHTPICNPSRSELLSGRYFHINKMVHAM